MESWIVKTNVVICSVYIAPAEIVAVSKPNSLAAPAPVRTLLSRGRTMFGSRYESFSEFVSKHVHHGSLLCFPYR